MTTRFPARRCRAAKSSLLVGRDRYLTRAWRARLSCSKRLWSRSFSVLKRSCSAFSSARNRSCSALRSSSKRLCRAIFSASKRARSADSSPLNCSRGVFRCSVFEYLSTFVEAWPPLGSNARTEPVVNIKSRPNSKPATNAALILINPPFSRPTFSLLLFVEQRDETHSRQHQAEPDIGRHHRGIAAGRRHELTAVQVIPPVEPENVRRKQAAPRFMHKHEQTEEGDVDRHLPSGNGEIDNP